jgi:autotransporter-associated beta strand protein
VLTGALSFSRAGNNTQYFYSTSNYTGATLLTGGTTVLVDYGAFTNTSSLGVNFATLTLDNVATNPNITAAPEGAANLTDRINPNAPITLIGGQIVFDGRAQTQSTETLGAVTIGSGLSSLQSVVGGTGINSADLTLTSLTQSNSAATGGTDGTLVVSGGLGLIGSAARILITSAPALTNNLIGAWIVTGDSQFASYNSSFGIGSLGQTGFAGYDATTITTQSNPTQNIKTAAFTLPEFGTNAVVTINTLTLGGSFGFTDGATILNLSAGGIINDSGVSISLGSTAQPGLLTAGNLAGAGQPQDLYIYNSVGTLTINSSAVNNPNGAAVKLVLTLDGGNITLTGASNSYSGGTVINGGAIGTGTVNLSSASAGTHVIPAAGGLTINGATVTETTIAGQIAPTTVITLNGTSTLNLLGNNTLGGLVFENAGGSPANVNQTGQLGSTGYMEGNLVNSGGVLLINGTITATSSNVGNVSTLGGRVDFGSGITIDAEPILVAGQSVAPLEASLAIQGIVNLGGFTKTGAGVLQLNAQDIYTGGTVIADGMLNTGVTNAGSRFSQLTLDSGAILNLDGFSTVWGSLSGAGTVFNSLASSSLLTVGYDGTSTTFSGAFSRNNDGTPADVSLTKIGAGTLTLTGAANLTPGTLVGTSSTGTLTVEQGTVDYSGAGTGGFQTNTVLGG